MSLDHRLIDLLVCPACKGPLQMRRDAELRPQDLACPACRLSFPIRDGIPVMLESEAQALDGPEPAPAPAPEPAMSRHAGAAAPFTVLIPARMASTRLPDKPLADIAGKPMVVRVAERVAACGADAVVVACDDPRIAAACAAHGVRALLTRADHASGSDRLAEAATALALADDTIVVNVQGDEPLIDPALVREVAALLSARPECVMATAAHPIASPGDYSNPNVVKCVLDADSRALYFSRAPIPVWRDGGGALPRHPAALRHVGLYAYRAGFLRAFPGLEPAPVERAESLEQLRVLWHGHRIAVHVTPEAPGAGVDTPEDLARVRAHFASRNTSSGAG